MARLAFARRRGENDFWKSGKSCPNFVIVGHLTYVLLWRDCRRRGLIRSWGGPTLRQFQRTVQVPWLVGCLLFISGFLSPANAQIMRIVNGVAQAEGTPQQGLLTIDEAVQNALTDFDRHAQRGDFQKAFRVLENLPLEKRVGMLPAGNGFMSPARVRFWRLLVEMNAEGRAAFRLFYEPKAKQLAERMKTELAADRTKALATASEIYEQYFITSYGDDAAEILGDASFEKGDFVEAASRWRSIIDYHAETNLSLPKVMAKCAAAYVGAGRLMMPGLFSVTSSVASRATRFESPGRIRLLPTTSALCWDRRLNSRRSQLSSRSWSYRPS